MQDIVSVKKLTKKFGDITAVDRMDLSIKEGEIYGLLGPNAAGKSTTINVLCGMQRKNDGEVKIFGKDIEKNIREIKANIGVVPQEIAIYGDLSAAENVRFFASLYGLRGAELKARTEEALDFVGLRERQKDLSKNFFGRHEAAAQYCLRNSASPKTDYYGRTHSGYRPAIPKPYSLVGKAAERNGIHHYLYNALHGRGRVFV